MDEKRSLLVYSFDEEVLVKALIRDIKEAQNDLTFDYYNILNHKKALLIKKSNLFKQKQIQLSYFIKEINYFINKFQNLNLTHSQKATEIDNEWFSAWGAIKH